MFHGRADAIILEGWCVGARPQPPQDLATPINALEATEDPHGLWRTFVNNQLDGSYAALFARLDFDVMLKAPSFACVFDWRREQETKLERPTNGSRPPMSDDELRRFIAHYERVTRWLMADQPADLVIDIGQDRTPLSWRRR
jgi:D-glycerate 3-kinase